MPTRIYSTFLLPADAALAWIAANPDNMAKWLQGVQTVDGKPAFEAVRAAIR